MKVLSVSDVNLLVLLKVSFRWDICCLIALVCVCVFILKEKSELPQEEGG